MCKHWLNYRTLFSFADNLKKNKVSIVFNRIPHMKDVCMYPILGVIFWQLKLKLKQFILSTNNSKGLPPFFSLGVSKRYFYWQQKPWKSIHFLRHPVKNIFKIVHWYHRRRNLIVSLNAFRKYQGQVSRDCFM